jgi:hypothetical protein
MTSLDEETTNGREYIAVFEVSIVVIHIVEASCRHGTHSDKSTFLYHYRGCPLKI